MLTAQEIRAKFLNFYKERGHHIAESGPLVPQNDPSLLFTNAGMVQFKKLFLGEEKKDWKRAATCQKCLRVSGKHNDLENVGRTARHHTFFEMLGNFSFGNYFKRDAITWAWQFVTEELNLPKDRLWVTVFRDDDEAAAIWKEVAGLPEERIVRMDEKDNFWTMGDTGPCGPCSEIYIDQGEEMACGPDCGIGHCDCDRFLEIWNLVFTQYDQSANGERTLLAAPNIDTGMGLERIAAVCQGKRSNFDCDLFQQIIQYAASLANVTYQESPPDTNDIDTALRVIADHARAAAFLIAEGILPSNEKRGYVLRRLIRRALRFATLMGINEPFLYKVATKVTEVMGEAYPELLQNARFIERAVYEEERRFAVTLQNGLHLLEEELAKLHDAGKNIVPGEISFALYDTYGFPLDIVVDVAEKKGFSVDSAGFEKLMKQQRELSRTNQKKAGLLGMGNSDELNKICKKLLEDNVSSKFIGYSALKTASPISVLLDHYGNPVNELSEESKGYVISKETPFYAESGGQVGDRGQITTITGKAKVINVLKPIPEIILHEVEIEAGEILQKQDAILDVDPDERLATARNHTCTHLLHASLRKILGDHVKQAGSLVNSQRLRFDFSHFTSLSDEELAAVERDVNHLIMRDLPVNACEMSKDEALAKGAMALFSEKYGEIVRVLSVGEPDHAPESIELCGGTHLERTGQAGSFYITGEYAVSAGTRRIEAITGWNAYDAHISQRAYLKEVSSLLKSSPEQLSEKIHNLQDDLKKMRKAIEKGTTDKISGTELVKKAEEINGISFLAYNVNGAAIKTLRETMDSLRGALSNKAVICLTSVDHDKVVILLYVSKDLHDKLTAPKLINLVAGPCGGSGGGRPDLAQAGGNNPDGIAQGFKNLKQALL